MDELKPEQVIEGLRDVIGALRMHGGGGFEHKVRAAIDLLSRQPGDAWIAWKPGDPAPRPCFHTQYLCTVRRMGTIDPVWLAIRDGWMFDDGTSTEVIAYMPAKLPSPFTGKDGP